MMEQELITEKQFTLQLGFTDETSSITFGAEPSSMTDATQYPMSLYQVPVVPTSANDDPVVDPPTLW